VTYSTIYLNLVSIATADSEVNLVSIATANSEVKADKPQG